MAKVKNPLFSESAVGQIGGLLYRNGTYGPIVSRRSLTPTLRTPAQTITRARFAMASSAWSALPDNAHFAWNAWATPPLTGRNEYIAAYTRLAPLNLTPPLFPRTTDTTDTLFNIQLFPISNDPPEVMLTWDYIGANDSLLLVYALTTFSNRLTPKPSKLTIVYAGEAYETLIQFLLPAKTPVVHIRLDIIDGNSGSIRSQILTRFTPTWL